MTQPPASSGPSATGPAGGVPTCYRHGDRETYISCQRCARPICPDCMRDASVGFQCPSCVSEGAKQTRQARTAYGGTRSGNPQLTSSVIIAVNLAVFLAMLGTGGERGRLYDLLTLVPRGRCDSVSNSGVYFPRASTESVCATVGDGQWIPGVADGAIWQLVTSAFAHTEIWHIGFNMLALWVLGPQLEAILGRVRFLVVYLLSALAGSATVMWLSQDFQTTLGASGAVFGLMGALLIVAIKVGGDVRGVLTWLGINAVITVVFPGISWQGHLGGFLGGLAVAAILVYAPRARRTPVQALGVGAVALLLVALVVARIAVLA